MIEKGDSRSDAYVAPPNQKKPRGAKVTKSMVCAGTVEFERATKDSDFDPKTMLRLVSWNVAGLRGFINRGGDLQNFCRHEHPDVVCLQETRLSDWESSASLAGVKGYSFVDSISVAKKGYSGTRTYVRDGIPAAHAYGLDVSAPSEHDAEGRVITTTLLGDLDLRIVNTYVPNAGHGLKRLDHRVGKFDASMRSFLAAQAKQGPVIWTGDLNVAERDYDRFWGGDFDKMQQGAGFTPDERDSFRKTLAEGGLVDAFRVKYPNAAGRGIYTFFTYRANQRARGNGWRLDYFALSASLASRVVDCFPLPQYALSDHVPLVLWLRKR